MHIPEALRSASGIRRLANLYRYDDRGYDPAEHLGQAVQRGYMLPEDLDHVAGWKWRGPIVRMHCWLNSEKAVREASTIAFQRNSSEEGRINALRSLHGVGYPMASVILHFAFPDSYPILDRRAMNAVGESTNYSFKKWMDYVKCCRSVAKKCGVTLRDLDKALWVYGGDRRCYRIDLVQDFHPQPYGRYRKDGPGSGQAFREDKLVPAMKFFDRVHVDLSGYDYYGSSFLKAAFSGLLQAGFTFEDIRKKVAVKHNRLPSIECEVNEYLVAALA